MDVFHESCAHRDESGRVCQFNHTERPFTFSDADEVTGSTPQGRTVRGLADQYMRAAMSHFDLPESAILETEAEAEGGVALVFRDEKSRMGNATVTYAQKHAGIDVWEAGFAVQVEEEPMQVIGSQSTTVANLELKMPAESAAYRYARINADVVSELFRLDQGTTVTIEEKAEYIYQYDAQDRSRVVHDDPDEADALSLALPPLHKSIKDGSAFLVTAVQFRCHSGHGGSEGWLALIEANTGSVLHLRSLAGCGMAASLIAPELMSIEPSRESSSTREISIADDSAPSVVFFDIGDTLGQAISDGRGSIARIDVFSTVPEILKELAEKSFRIGIISNPGSFSEALINSLLQDAEIFEFFEPALVIYGVKDSREIFTNAATIAGVLPSECAFVGENTAERGFAQAAGFRVAAAPDSVFAIVDPEAALAWVYETDPATKLGNRAPAPTAPTAELDDLRDLVSLRGLRSAPPGSDQTLRGEFVSVQQVEPPNTPVPQSPPPGDFRFSVSTNNFGAVNAYYNCDRLFRILEDFGFDVGQYFNGTTFPVRVDHRVRYRERNGLTANIVNASAPGSALPPASDGFRFALAAVDTAVGMASAWRVVLHEFGHTLLWDNVGSPNFRFAHSAGDALAAILNDAGNQAPRQITFPWTGIQRSHMRPVRDFAWHGSRFEPFLRNGRDSAGYVAEQMLSSTLFRVYRAAGGDSAETATQRFAASYVTFLIIKAIGMMSRTNNPRNPEGFADLMMQADSGLFLYRGAQTRSGALRKVIRWAFEMQGAYRQPTFPRTNRIGNPPLVDVFINDGRDGQYEFSTNRDSIDIWNRRAADDGSVHQPPVAGEENFAYVRVANRGLAPAEDVRVRGFQSSVPRTQNWPTDWDALSTEEVTLPNPVDPGMEVVAGPFKWFPGSANPTLLMSVSATGDQSNADRFTTTAPIPNSRLVPLDNNIAQRQMATTPG